MSEIIGIDLGTTNSVIAAMGKHKPLVIPNKQGNLTTPSVVAYTDAGERLVGQRAKNQTVTNPENTVHSIKRFMGKLSDELDDKDKNTPYKLVLKAGKPVNVQIQGDVFSPPQISAAILQELKSAAEDYLGEPVTEAVVTVPAYFNDSQRQATKDAGEIAGLTVKRIINEPTAAALAYGLDKTEKDTKVAVFDLGGGTFDISILDVCPDAVSVLATAGDTDLGGDDFDAMLVNYVAKEFEKKHNVDLLGDNLALQRLRIACERCKKELSSSMSAQINEPYITAVDDSPLHLQMEITRAKFDILTEPVIEQLNKPCKQCIEDSGLSVDDIDEVILVGGSTRIPAVQTAVENIFNKPPSKNINPDEAVGLGAAVQGAIISGDVNDMLLLDVTPLTLGIETKGGVMAPMITRNTTIPFKKKEVFTTAEPNQPAVDIQVFQGESKMVGNNRKLGTFQLDGIPPSPAGVPQIEVEFDIDVNGILSVTARDLGSGKEQNVTIKSSSGLSDEEIEEMKKKADDAREDDERQFELITARNEAEALIARTKKQLDELSDSIAAPERGGVEDLVKDVEESLNSDDADLIKSASNALTNQMYKISEQLYSNNSSQ